MRYPATLWRPTSALPLALICTALLCTAFSAAVVADSDADRLVAAMRGETPMVDDLRSLTDEVGGRPTGSEANREAVEWAVERLRQAGVKTWTEAFTMPALWLEESASAVVRSTDGEFSFEPRIVAAPFSAPASGLTAPLVDGGIGSDSDFERLGDSARGALVVIETEELHDVPGLFKEYGDNYATEGLAMEAGVGGLVYVGSRSRNVLHRHNASRGPGNELPILAIERESGLRVLRLLRDGHSLELTTTLSFTSGGAYQSRNVIAEIKGSVEPEQFVVIGAHLDSWGLGTGALDNGCNVALVIDLARQIKRLGLTPKRTIRFALWNGEEQGMHGSWGYVQTHAEELDRHVMASSFDIGSGRITGFFTGGRPEILEQVARALEPVADLGPFSQLDIPLVGTDNYDFMIEGIANLVANQESANYGPNYHADTDTFDKVDQEQLRLNGAIAGAIIWGFANDEISWSRQSRAEIEKLIASGDLESQMRMFNAWEPWIAGVRGRAD